MWYALPIIVLRTCLNGKISFSTALQRDVISKTYRYAYLLENDVFASRYSWYPGRERLKSLDVAAMKRAAALFIGKGDFTAYTTLESLTKHKGNAIRIIQGAHVFESVIEPGSPPRLYFEVASSGFMYHQVRHMAGMLLEVGIGRRPETDITRSLQTADSLLAARECAPNFFAPAKGLCLMSVQHKTLAAPH
jgi:tRNA pseudouridine38-40 synthase